MREDAIIIFITDLPLWSMEKGSGAPSFFRTVDLYKNKGHKIYFITTNSGEKASGYFSEEELIVIDNERYIPFLKIPKICYFANELRHLCFGIKVRKIVRALLGREESKKAVLYAYEIFGVKAARKLSREIGCPFITRFQGTFLCGKKHTITDRVRFHLHYDALRVKSDLMIMTDDGTEGENIVRHLGNSMDNIYFWRNGVDLVGADIEELQRFDKETMRKRWGMDKNDIVLLTVSRLVEWKRVDRALNAFSQISQSSEGVKLLIVGEGSERKALEELSVKLGVQEKVIFTGLIPQEEAYQYMLISDIFLSLYDISNLGNPLFEAMALGKCIVTLKNGTTGTVIKDRYNGRIINPEKIEELPEILDELILDGQKRGKLGEKAREYALEHFTTWGERMEMEYSAMKKLLQEKGIE